MNAGLVVLCLVEFFFVFIWLSVPVHSTACRNLSPKWPVMCRVGR